MKIIEKYILKEMQMPIFFGVSIFTFIFLMDIIVAMMENILIRGISILDTVRMLSFYLPPILSQTIPMGIFFGVLLTFTKFTKSSESIAFSAMGMGIKQVVKPIFKYAVLVTAFIFFLQESIIPQSFKKLQYLTMKIAMENPVFQMQERVFLDDIDEFSIYINEIDRKTGNAQGVIIFQNDDDSKFPLLLVGENAKWKNDSMIISNSEFVKFTETGEEELQGSFKDKIIPLSAYAKDFKIRISDLETAGVISLIKKYKDQDEKDKILYSVEINKKLAVPLSTIMLAILGFLLANGHHRSGKGTNFGLSILVIFFYIVVLNIGIVSANRGKLNPIVAVWTPNLILATVTYILYRKKASVM